MARTQKDPNSTKLGGDFGGPHCVACRVVVVVVEEDHVRLDSSFFFVRTKGQTLRCRSDFVFVLSFNSKDGKLISFNILFSGSSALAALSFPFGSVIVRRVV